MPDLTPAYPDDLPAFLRERPAPREWQERVQGVDRDLWVAWNTEHLDGPRWCILRHRGPQTVNGGAVLIERTEAKGVPGAIMRGWSFVKSCEDPDGNECGVSDHIIGWLRHNDTLRRYGSVEEGADLALADERKSLETGRQEKHDALMNDAFRDMQNDHTLTRGRRGVIVPGGVT